MRTSSNFVARVPPAILPGMPRHVFLKTCYEVTVLLINGHKLTFHLDVDNADEAAAMVTERDRPYGQLKSILAIVKRKPPR